jgi:hypothetical protein
MGYGSWVNLIQRAEPHLEAVLAAGVNLALELDELLLPPRSGASCKKLTKHRSQESHFRV